MQYDTAQNSIGLYTTLHYNIALHKLHYNCITLHYTNLCYTTRQYCTFRYTNYTCYTTLLNHYNYKCDYKYGCCTALIALHYGYNSTVLDYNYNDNYHYKHDYKYKCAAPHYIQQLWLR